MFAACLSFYRSNPNGDSSVRSSAMFGHIRQALSYYLAGLSTMHEGAYPGWKADQDNPGYMIRIDPPVIMRAPYHLVCAFPSETSLDAIWRLSRSVKTLSTSVLCLSGSAAIMKASISVGDLDFCEYVVGGRDEITESLIGKIQGIRELIFRHFRFGTMPVDQSYDEANVRAQLQSIKSSDPEFSHAKIDFIGKPDGMRPTDVSNVIIFCDADWRSASLHRSFAAQEAHLDPVVTVPNMLCEPYEIGRYVDFLLAQANGYLAQRNFVKSLKRCLPLARLCFLSSVSEEVTRFIPSSPEFLEHEIAVIDRLITVIGSSVPDPAEWTDELAEARQDLEHDLAKAQRRPHIESVEIFCRRIIATLDTALAGQDLKAA